MNKTPPITPPIIAPVCEELFGEGVGEVEADGVLDGVLDVEVLEAEALVDVLLKIDVKAASLKDGNRFDAL